MNPQLTHELAAHTLRLLIADYGNYSDYHHALDFLIDELREANKALDAARRDIVAMETAEARASILTVQKVARKGD